MRSWSSSLILHETLMSYKMVKEKREAWQTQPRDKSEQHQ